MEHLRRGECIVCLSHVLPVRRTLNDLTGPEIALAVAAECGSARAAGGGHRRWMPREFRSGWLINTLLVLTLAFFAWYGYREIGARLAA